MLVVRNLPDVNPQLNKFGNGYHGFDGTYPNRTLVEDVWLDAVQEEIRRPISAVMGALGGVETDVNIPKYNQLMLVMFGLIEASAAFQLEPVTDMGLSIDGIVVAPAEFQASTVAGYKSLVMLGQNYRELVMRREQPFLTVGDQIPGEDPRSIAEIPNVCWVAVGTTGSIFKRDGGGPSTPASGTTETLNCIAYNEDEDVLIAAGDNGTCIKSTDQGDTWSPCTVTGASNNDFRAIIVADGEFFLFQSSTGKVYVTTDGVAWDERSFGQNNVNDVAYLPQTKTFLVVGSSGNCARSHDRFQTSPTSAQIQGMDASCFSVAANPEGCLFVVAGRDSNGDDLMAVSINGVTPWRYHYFHSAGGAWFTDTHIKARFINGRYFFPNDNTKFLRSAPVFLGNGFMK